MDDIPPELGSFWSPSPSARGVPGDAILRATNVEGGTPAVASPVRERVSRVDSAIPLSDNSTPRAMNTVHEMLPVFTPPPARGLRVVQATLNIGGIPRSLPVLYYTSPEGQAVVYPFSRRLLGTVWKSPELVNACTFSDVVLPDPFDFCSRRMDLPPEMVHALLAGLEANGGGPVLDEDKFREWSRDLRDPEGSFYAPLPCTSCGTVNKVRFAELLPLSGITQGVSCAALGKACRQEHMMPWTSHVTAHHIQNASAAVAIPVPPLPSSSTTAVVPAMSRYRRNSFPPAGVVPASAALSAASAAMQTPLQVVGSQAPTAMRTVVAEGAHAINNIGVESAMTYTYPEQGTGLVPSSVAVSAGQVAQPAFQTASGNVNYPSANEQSGFPVQQGFPAQSISFVQSSYAQPAATAEQPGMYLRHGAPLQSCYFNTSIATASTECRCCCGSYSCISQRPIFDRIQGWYHL